jgi:hypothetical protein
MDLFEIKKSIESYVKDINEIKGHLWFRYYKRWN